MQQTAVQRGLVDLDPVRKHKATLELARGDALVQEHPLGAFFGLLAPDDQMAIF